MKLVFDIEANGLEPRKVTQVHCICIIDLETNNEWKFGPDKIEEALSLLKKAKWIVGHNIISYDLPVLKYLWGFTPQSTIIDTLILSRLLYPDRTKPLGLPGVIGPHSIEAWGHRFGTPKQAHDDWQNFSEEMLERCIKDTRIQRRLYLELCKEAECTKDIFDTRWSNAFKLEIMVAKIQYEQEDNGWLLDQDLCHKHLAELDAKVAEFDRQIHEQAPLTIIQGKLEETPFRMDGQVLERLSKYYDREDVIRGPFQKITVHKLNISSDKQIKEFLLSQGWQPDEWNFKDGERTSPKLTESSLASVRGGLGGLVAERIVHEHRARQLRGFLENVRPDGRISAEANTIGTNTYRFTHRKVVNVPKAKAHVFFGKQMRSVFTVGPGRKQVGCDAKGLENRIMGHYINDPEMTAVLCDGDFHTYFWNSIRDYCNTRDNAKNIEYALTMRACKRL